MTEHTHTPECTICEDTFFVSDPEFYEEIPCTCPKAKEFFAECEKDAKEAFEKMVATY